MPQQNPSYSISDTQGVDDNLQEFSKFLESIDPELAPILAGRLSEFTASESPVLHQLWDDLLAATTSKSPEATDGDTA